MKTIISIVAISVFITCMAFAQQHRAEGTYLEYPRTTVFPIKDTQSGGQYELYIKLPEAYAEDPNKRYPVLYYTDALWHIEILSASTEFIIEDVILVGISWQKDINEALLQEHGQHVSRIRDYTVTPLEDPERQAKYQVGQAANHLAFIRNDVIQYVEKNYRTDPDNRSYFGYSAGGIFGTYALLAQPDTFKHYILGSPAVDGDIPALSSVLSKQPSDQGFNANVFISYGTLENELGGYGDQLINLLQAREDKSLSLTHKLIEGSHQTAFPLTGVQSVTWLAELIKQ
jgi:predicted alpha/beta superfamily hydrolase